MGNIIGTTIETLKEEVVLSGKIATSQITGSKQNTKQPKQSPKVEQSEDQKDFVKDLYGQAPPVEQQEVEQKEMEDKQKIEALRVRLHSDYYQKLVNPPKQQEEKPAEKVEREKMEDLQKEEKDKTDKPPPLAVDRAQNMEKFRGVSG